MGVPLEKIPLKEILTTAKCPFYEPQGDTDEGICRGSGRDQFVSRRGGCNNPEGCLTYQEKIGGNNYGKTKSM